MAQKGLSPTGFQNAALTRLAQQAVLCARCEPLSEMLCQGLRPEFDHAASDTYKTLRVINRACPKLEKRLKEEAEAKRFELSGVPPSAQTQALETKVSVALRGPQLTNLVVEGYDIPVLCQGQPTLEVVRGMWAVIMQLCKQGHLARFVYPQWWYEHYREWDRLAFENLTTCAWLYVEKIDAGNGTDYARSLMLSAVAMRIAAELPTFVTMASENPKGRNEFEQQLFQEVLTWPTLPKELNE